MSDLCQQFTPWSLVKKNIQRLEIHPLPEIILKGKNKSEQNYLVRYTKKESHHKNPL